MIDKIIIMIRIVDMVLNLNKGLLVKQKDEIKVRSKEFFN